MVQSFLCRLSRLYFTAVAGLKQLDGLGPLALRLFLGPIFIFAGLKKWNSIEQTAQWFGNSDWGLGLPFPELLAWLATLAELGGGVALLLGVAVRLFSVPLMITMLVAIFAVHWPNGWQSIADKDWLYANERVQESAVRLDKAKQILREHGNYSWLTGRGNLVISNDGIEFGVTYLVMLLMLLFTGGGRYVSVDYWVAREVKRRQHVCLE